jgi:sec-independent protein translocase protein TatA
MRLGPVEIGLILVIVLIVFGIGKLPQVGGALGKGLHEFRQASKGEDESVKEAEKKPADNRTDKV